MRIEPKITNVDVPRGNKVSDEEGTGSFASLLAALANLKVDVHPTENNPVKFSAEGLSTSLASIAAPDVQSAHARVMSFLLGLSPDLEPDSVDAGFALSTTSPVVTEAEIVAQNTEVLLVTVDGLAIEERQAILV